MEVTFFPFFSEGDTIKYPSLLSLIDSISLPVNEYKRKSQPYHEFAGLDDRKSGTRFILVGAKT